MPNPAIIIFDGECAFCDKSVRWIINHDPADRFRFAPRQSPAGQALLKDHGLPPQGVESLILVDGPNLSTHSTAVLRIAASLPLPWKLAGTFLLVPKPLRDFLYRALAKRRYRIAGKLDACAVPTPQHRERIIYDDPRPVS